MVFILQRLVFRAFYMQLVRSIHIYPPMHSWRPKVFRLLFSFIIPVLALFTVEGVEGKGAVGGL